MSHQFPPLGGFQPLSLVDFPGKACAVVFLQGCNLCCPFCHNPDLIGLQANAQVPTWESVLKILGKRKGIVDAATISGGEPCLHRELPSLLHALREMGFACKLDTNGTLPDPLQRILQEGLLDYVAMDIKAPFDGRMDAAIGKSGFVDRIAQSMKIISQSGIAHEFRTTLHHQLSSTELRALQETIPLDSSWFLQRCRDVPNRYKAPILERPDSLTHPGIAFRGFEEESAAISKQSDCTNR